MLTKKDFSRIKYISASLYDISRGVRVLRHLKWPESVQYEFFASKAEVLPTIDYPQFDYKTISARLRSLEGKYGDTPYDIWLKDKAFQIEESSQLLNFCGKEIFFQQSSKLYGAPKYFLSDEETSSLDIAYQFESILDYHFLLKHN